eukprot:949397-Pyramimonas_sp.AAC.1
MMGGSESGVERDHQYVSDVCPPLTQDVDPGLPSDVVVAPAAQASDEGEVGSFSGAPVVAPLVSMDLE